jgi:glycosyltransferase involved in cell wall biosynthesis
MRIAGVDPERNFSGGEAQVMGLTLELRRGGHEVELLCDPDGDLWQRATEAAVVCRPLKIRNSLDAAAGLRLRGLLRRHRYDVLHFHTARAHAMAPYAAGGAAALIVTRRMDYVPNRFFAPSLYNHAVDGVAAISHGVAQALMRAGVAPERITIIPSGVDGTRFMPPSEAMREQARAALGLSANDIAVGTIGALVPRKGHLFLVEAIGIAQRAILHDRASICGNLRCFIAGAGPLQPEIAERIAQHDLAETITLVGRIDDPATLLNGLDIFVMPSLNEGMGVAALEASAAGLPVVASNVGGLPEVVANARSGILVEPRNAEMLAEAIMRLATNRQQRSEMGLEGRKRAVQNWSIEVMARRTMALYETCLSRLRPAAGVATSL